MSRGAIFWILMILWLIFSVWGSWPMVEARNYGFVGGAVLQFVLFALLGWQVFGKPIKD